MDNKIKLEFIKRVLTDTVDDTQICENFFTIYTVREKILKKL
jgi:hypothetical protein